MGASNSQYPKSPYGHRKISMNQSHVSQFDQEAKMGKTSSRKDEDDMFNLDGRSRKFVGK